MSALISLRRGVSLAKRRELDERIIPWNARVLALGACESAANIMRLARDIVRSSSISQNLAVDVCAALILAHVAQKPNTFLISLAFDLKSEADKLIESYCANGPHMAATVAAISRECADLLQRGLSGYSLLKHDERDQLIEELKRDASKYIVFANGRSQEKITVEYPALLRRSIAFAAFSIGVIIALFVPAARLLDIVLLPAAGIGWFAPFSRTVDRWLTPGEVMGIIRRRAEAKEYAIDVTRTLINEVRNERFSLSPWMQPPQLEIEDSDMEWIRVFGSVDAKHRRMTSQYYFTMTFWFDSTTPMERHRNVFLADVHKNLTAAREKLAEDLHIVD